MISNLLEKIFQNNIYIFAVVIVIIFLIMNYIETHIAVGLLVVSYIMVNYEDLFSTIKSMESNSVQKEKLIEDNVRTNKEISWNPKIEHIVHKLKKYKKYNPNAYEDGHKYIRMYTYTINDLERDDIGNHNHYFETAVLYYKQSINNFQSMSISVPEESTYQALKFNKLTTMKLANRIGSLCKRLQKECYNELYNLSIRLDERWKQNPSIYSKGIHMNSDGVEEYNKTIDKYWDYY